MASNSTHAQRTGMSDKTVKKIRDREGIPEPREAIRQYAQELPEKSNREVARDLGVDRNAVNRNVAANSEIPEKLPAPVFTPGDIDELNQSPTEQSEPAAKAEPRKPRRTPITDDANRIGWEIRKIAEKLEALTEDDRYDTNKEKVTPLLRGHLQFVIETATNILDDLTTPEE